MNVTTLGRAGALATLSASLLLACSPGARPPDTAAPLSAATHLSESAIFWNSATVYFLLTDRFENGDPANDLAQGRQQDGAVLRSFQGGDLKGVLHRLEEGYFDDLGVNVLWMTPFQEQILGSVDEGTGKTYGFHGYWTRDWTAVEPALGTLDDLRAVVDEAHRRGIRVLMDAIVNHTGPVTPLDPQWPEEWVRTEPRCAFRSYTTTVDCTLVENLPDIRTARDAPVELPPQLVEKWEEEGRLEKEMAELDDFFRRTGHPRAPRYYIIKWLTDWVRELGFDGYRVDTAKHFEEWVAVELKREAEWALAEWRAEHPERISDDLPFYMMGEVYHYDIANGRAFNFGDQSVDFFDYGYDALVNFGLRRDAPGSLDELFAHYATALQQGDLQGQVILNYVSSHDDGDPYDPRREDPFGSGTRLLLAPGGAQIYYGDELARPLQIDGAQGDANLRSVMNWDDLEEGGRTATILEHWQKLGRFRAAHPAVGAGEHRHLQEEPYVFSRTLETGGLSDRVVVALDLEPGPAFIPVSGVFPDGTELVDAYSGTRGKVVDGAISLTTDAGLVLLSKAVSPGFMIGGDISFLPEIEANGGTYSDAEGEKDLLRLLGDHGFNAVRLKLWHSPDRPYNGLEQVKAMAARIDAAGMSFLLDVHYSDDWADPQKQIKPAAWNGLAFEALVDSVYQYSRDVLASLREQGTVPDIVQIGNEIRTGMLWPDGRIDGEWDTPRQWDRLVALLEAGRRGVLDAAPDQPPAIMIHFDNGAKNQMCRGFFDKLIERGLEFDLIGLSFYPKWHGTLTELEANLPDLASRYKKDIHLVETAYPWTFDWLDDTGNLFGTEADLHEGFPPSLEGQSAFLRRVREIVQNVPGGRGAGVFYWSPEWIAVPGVSSAWENATLFDFNGRALPSMNAFTGRE